MSWGGGAGEVDQRPVKAPDSPVAVDQHHDGVDAVHGQFPFPLRLLHLPVQAGKFFVLHDQLRLLFHQLALVSLPRTDVLLDPEEMGDGAACIGDRGDQGAFPEKGAVLAPVVELAVPLPSGADGLPEAAVELGRLRSGLEEAGIAPQHLLFRIAGGFRELAVHVLDEAAAVGDDDGAGALLYRLGEEPQRLLRPRPFGKVVEGFHHRNHFAAAQHGCGIQKEVALLAVQIAVPAVGPHHPLHHHVSLQGAVEPRHLLRRPIHHQIAQDRPRLRIKRLPVPVAADHLRRRDPGQLGDRLVPDDDAVVFVDHEERGGGILEEALREVALLLEHVLVDPVEGDVPETAAHPEVLPAGAGHLVAAVLEPAQLPFFGDQADVHREAGSIPLAAVSLLPPQFPVLGVDDAFQKPRLLQKFPVPVSGKREAVGGDVADRVVGGTQEGELRGEAGDDPVQLAVLHQDLLLLIHLPDHGVHRQCQVLQFVPGRQDNEPVVSLLVVHGADVGGEPEQRLRDASDQEPDHALAQHQGYRQHDQHEQTGLAQGAVGLMLRAADHYQPVCVGDRHG
jgi:hypothetical protein